MANAEDVSRPKALVDARRSTRKKVTQRKEERKRRRTGGAAGEVWEPLHPASGPLPGGRAPAA